MRILLLGASGQVGWELARVLAPLGTVHAPGRDVADLANPDALGKLVQDLRPQVICNAAAYTAVDQAESDESRAQRINGEAPGALGRAAAACGAALVHYSTDYVFDGQASRPYAESDPTGPLGAYGRSKLAGERAVLESGAPALVFRTSWVYASRGKNFPLTMLRLARERDRLRVVGDQIGAPTPATLIATVTALALAQLGNPQTQPERWQARSGLYHLSCAGSTSWHGFARAIFDWRQRNHGLVAPTVEEIGTVDYPTPAARPAYSLLDNAKLARAFALALPAWDEAFELSFAGAAG